MAHSGTSRSGRLTPPLKSPMRVNTVPAYNQIQKLPLVLPNKPQVSISQTEQQKQEQSMTGTDLEYFVVVVVVVVV